MRIRTVLLVIGIALVAVFAALNWSAFMTETALNLVFARVEAPLGIVMLGVLVAAVLMFLAYMAFWQGNVLLEMRRHAKELQAQRALAEQAESSRLTQLRDAVMADTDRLAVRIDELREGLRAEMREGVNSLAAMLGEMDDRTKRISGS
ncbi:MAG: LapA family protein [Caldimonas sp.]